MGAIAVIWLLWLCRNDKIFNDTKFFLNAGNLRMYTPASFMVVCTTCGVLRHIYGGVCLVGRYSERLFLSDMDGSIVFGLVLHQHRLLISPHLILVIRLG